MKRLEPLFAAVSALALFAMMVLTFADVIGRKFFDNSLPGAVELTEIFMTLMIYFALPLASLAILVWHMYSVIFHPHVYPMNPSWLTGQMPEDMYKHEHPGHLEEARRETERVIEKRIERMRRRNGTTDDGAPAQPIGKPKAIGVSNEKHEEKAD